MSANEPLLGAAHPRVVTFDFDHTLTVRDSVVPFVVRVAGLPRVAGAVVKTLPTVLSLVRRRDNDGLKEHFAMHCLSGLDAGAASDAGLEHARRIVSSRMRADTCARLRWHQEQGDVVVIVSASFGAYMHVVGDLLEVDAVLCTELEEQDGTLTGRLDGPNCRGAEKVRRISEWLAAAGLPDGALEIAYGDSAGDDEMLAMAAIAVRVSYVELEATAADGADQRTGAVRGRVVG